MDTVTFTRLVNAVERISNSLDKLILLQEKQEIDKSLLLEKNDVKLSTAHEYDGLSSYSHDLPTAYNSYNEVVYKNDILYRDDSVLLNG